jgi:chitinase
MRNIFLIAGVATLAACSAAAPTEEPAKAKTPEEAIIGTYDVTKADGKKMLSSVAPDHSYTDSEGGTVSEFGTWALKDGKFCSTPTSAGAKAMCVTLSEPAADGTITITADDGTKMTAKKLD